MCKIRIFAMAIPYRHLEPDTAHALSVARASIFY